MNIENTKLKSMSAVFALLCLLATSSTWAQTYPPIRITSISVPPNITYPLGGFPVGFTLTGAKYGGIGAGIIGVEFYLSDTPSGSNQVYRLKDTTVRLTGTTYGPYFPPSGTITTLINPSDMDPDALAVMQDIATGCQPQNWYILGYVFQTSLVSASSTLGTYNPPDLFFTGGALSPSYLPPGGTTNLSYTLFRQCPGNIYSRVGIFLADANHQLLSFIGEVSTPGWAGVSTLPPSGITFSPYIPPGNYHIVLIADVDGVVPEYNENNNVGSFPLTITSSARSSLSQDSARLESGVVLPDEAASAVRRLEPGGFDAYLHPF
ncbi:MAG TPA: hypothetical protein VEU33_48195 [Archangium sp.]|nr:hypothetical protein [Archangium sp.]